jgi:3-oxoadipate enol-lactonase
VSAVALHHRLSGPPTAPVVVLTGSLGTDFSMWEPQATALATRFRVLQVDLRGHGGSPAPAGPYSMGDLGGDLLALLDRLDVKRASLCGLSIGGMISLWVAAHAPARVQRLAVCCTTAHFGADVAQAYRERAEYVRRHGLATIADSVVGRWFTPAFAERHPDVVGRLREGLLAVPPEGYAGCCEALAELDLRPDLATIAAPTLVLAGEEDPATPPEHGQAIAAAIPQAELELVACAAHLASVERAELVTALLLRFLQNDQESLE